MSGEPLDVAVLVLIHRNDMFGGQTTFDTLQTVRFQRRAHLVNSSTQWTILCATMTLTLAVSGTGIAAAQEPDPSVPRYRLAVGQEYSYSGSSEFKYPGGSYTSESDWQFWVVSKNADGSWRVIVSKTERASHRREPQVTVAHFDVLSDGRIMPNATIGMQCDPGEVLVQFPSDKSVMRDGWTVADDRTGARRVHRSEERATAGEDVLVIIREDMGIAHEIYETSSKAEITFDTARGLVERIDTEVSAKGASRGRGTGEITLQSITMRDGAWTKKFAAEMERFFHASATYRKLTKMATEDADQCEVLLAQARALLEQQHRQVTFDLIRNQYASLLQGHEEASQYYEESAKRIAEVVGQPAFRFQTTDFKGNAHSLEQYRGNVVILDFWYRSCGWCIRAMPQLKQIARTFEGRPVVLFGMNIDRKEEDALFVIDKMGLNYTNLRAQGVPERYSVGGYPTLVIVDQQGIVRSFHVGYAPDLAESISDEVNQLLEDLPSKPLDRGSEEQTDSAAPAGAEHEVASIVRRFLEAIDADNYDLADTFAKPGGFTREGMIKLNAHLELEQAKMMEAYVGRTNAAVVTNTIPAKAPARTGRFGYSLRKYDGRWLIRDSDLLRHDEAVEEWLSGFRSVEPAAERVAVAE